MSVNWLVVDDKVLIVVLSIQQREIAMGDVAPTNASIAVGNSLPTTAFISPLGHGALPAPGTSSSTASNNTAAAEIQVYSRATTAGDSNAQRNLSMQRHFGSNQTQPNNKSKARKRGTEPLQSQAPAASSTASGTVPVVMAVAPSVPEAKIIPVLVLPLTVSTCTFSRVIRNTDTS